MIDMQDAGDTGVLIDMKYEIIDGVEKVIDISVRNIINNIVGEIVQLSNPLYKIAFATNFLTLLEQERNKK
jgi:hypothetical protein